MSGRGEKWEDTAEAGKGFGYKSNPRTPLFNEPRAEKNYEWIFYCGASDTMTFDKTNFLSSSKPIRALVQTANGELSKVKGAGVVEISPNIRLSNSLFVPTLSHKLL